MTLTWANLVASGLSFEAVGVLAAMIACIDESEPLTKSHPRGLSNDPPGVFQAAIAELIDAGLVIALPPIVDGTPLSDTEYALVSRRLRR